jgi:RNA polymerase sigma-70 factor (ECF subfamily)
LKEEQFIGQLKEGNLIAYKELVAQFTGRIYNTALGFLQNNEDAEDITQEVFIEIYQSVSQFTERSKLSTWIYRITASKSLELIRRRNRKKRTGILFSLFGKEDHIAVTSTSPFYHPGVKLENKERAAVLFQAIKKLPLNQRTAFTLHNLENLSYAELAEIMGVSVSSVESLMFRAKQNLRKLLGNYYNQNEK